MFAKIIKNIVRKLREIFNYPEASVIAKPKPSFQYKKSRLSRTFGTLSEAIEARKVSIESRNVRTAKKSRLSRTFGTLSEAIEAHNVRTANAKKSRLSRAFGTLPEAINARKSTAFSESSVFYSPKAKPKSHCGSSGRAS